MKKYRCTITQNNYKVGNIIDELKYKSLSMEEQRDFEIINE